MRINFNKLVDNLILGNFLLIIFLLPIYFSVFFITENVFELNKIALFKIGVLLLVFFSIIKFLFTKNINKTVFPPGLIFVLLFFIFTQIFATVFSINSSLSFFGSLSRLQGLESIIYCLVFFLLFIINFDFKDKGKIITFVCLSSFVVSLYGILQYVGWDFINWNEPTIFTKRITSTLGQPNFLAVFLCLTIPWALYLVIKAKNIWFRFTGVIVLVVNVLALFLTGSRSGYIGMILGFAFAGILFFLITRIKITKRIIFSIAIAGILVCFLAVPFWPRIKSMTDLKAGSANARLVFWSASIDAIKDKPLFGYGQENQGEVLSKYYKKNWAKNGQVNQCPDRAHNIILDILLTGGLFGLVGFLIFWAYIFWQLARKIKKQENSFFYFCLSASLLSYFVCLFFGFDCIVTSVYFWLLCALVIAPEEINIGSFQLNIKKYLKVLLIISIVLLIAWLMNREYRAVKNDYYYHEISLASYSDDREKAIGNFLKIIPTGNAGAYYDYRFGQIIADWLEKEKNPKLAALEEFVAEDIFENFKENTFNANYTRGRLAAALSARDEKYKKEAEQLLKNAKNHSSEMPKIYIALANFYCAHNEYDLAEENWQQALKSLPALPDVEINYILQADIMNNIRKINIGWGDCYLKQKNYKKAGEHYKIAYINRVDDITLLKKIADTYYLQGRTKYALPYILHGQNLNPEDFTWPWSAALLYDELGDKKNAKKYSQTALSLSPDNKAIKDFINKLNDGR